VHATDSEEHDMSETTEYVRLFDDTIKALFSDAVRIMLQDPSVAAFFVRMRRAQRMAKHRRALLAARRGFIHISPSGRVEPCPFAPYSDANVRDVPLRDALASPLLATIRTNHDRLTETSGGCALWSQREWVQSLLPRAEEKDATDREATT
jgi:MoaA/NifB/PqqE/SkfB family radical SAM enzyme